ncbi:ChbG/HpnK family deacetylase [Terriglobus aquaticus]|uniref:ChbG/HpnK family deacetylase n=1 Tax=Terriglobus aquaticus TaxID=940139 RepID=A0ABW9KKH3_9BACT|nr:ChbG/HpnK family deacetylase [Terriglobus aquaticus]
MSSAGSPIQLIVNADDFGMTAGVNRAVAELHAAGALTSTTLMACGPKFDEAARIARDLPSLGVGCHVVLVDGTPTSPPTIAASLLAPNGAFTSSMADFALGVEARYTKPKHIEIEVAAQIAKLQDAGIAVTHVDTHKHTHLLPRVARAVMRGAQRMGIRRIRNPFEPAWCSAISPAPLSRKLPFRLLHQFQSAFQRLLAEEGMLSPDASLGLIATGSLDSSILERILSSVPPGTYELVCHPGYVDAELQKAHTKLRESREIERQALLDVVPQLPADHFQCISFAEVGRDSTGPLAQRP